MFPDNIVEQCLTCCWCVGESEGHDQVFEVSVACPKRGFLFVTFLHPNQVVSSLEVELSKNFCVAEPVLQFCYVRQWISILDRDLVEAPVIHT